MSTPREKFQELLKKLFQFDCAELDFGIYRIMNQKRAVIEQFIETDLVKGIAKELKSGALAQEAGLAQQLAEVTAQIKENIGDEALDAEGNLATEYQGSKLGKQYLALRERAGKAKATPELEADIFNHLYAFFSRYYDDGDFMSLRRYSKRDKYAIPYNGEEVHLHWANADQYYIKTGENFTDYSYKHGGWTVQFKLRTADVEQNNVKGAKRFFIPRAADVALDGKNSTLTIPFEFRPLNASEEISYGKSNGAEKNGSKAKTKKKKGQEGILADAIAAIQNAAKKNADALAALIHEKRKDADGETITLLEHHLRTYVRGNSTDFFIHKDLKGFLERELDFYLKNEVLNLDELEAGGEARAESWFQTLRAIKGIGRKIIAFVAQIEDFQKRLFEKKKFVTEVHYCVTLDRVPEELYPEIAKNKAQIDEWKWLFHIHKIERDTTQQGFKEPVKVEFLKANPFLVLDTKNFSTEFKEKLLESKTILKGATTLDEAIDGLLIHGENFQSLTLIQSRYRHEIDCLYLDPPYNTDASPIVYKNDYRDSSWLSLLADRLEYGFKLLAPTGAASIAIDDYELANLCMLLARDYSNFEVQKAIVNHYPGSGTGRSNISRTHEYNLFVIPRGLDILRGQERDAGVRERNFRRSGTGENNYRTGRENSFFAILVDPATFEIKGIEEPPPLDKADYPKGKTSRGYDRIYPYGEDNSERVWSLSYEGALDALEKKELYCTKNSVIIRIYNDEKARNLLQSVWLNNKFNATTNGTNLLTDIFGGSGLFSYPKSVFTVLTAIEAITHECIKSTVLDFFGGSGTTAHAVIELNRANKKRTRKYILIEVGDYFDAITKGRIQKIIYSRDWNGGEPVSRIGSSHLMKYFSLESYEDALANVTFDTADAQTMFQLEDYVLSYMLGFETKQSETLLNVAKLDAPFDYKLRRYGKDEPLPVDLPETFNYLIGLHVASRTVHDNKGARYLVYRGKADGRETVILWRTTRGWKQEQFEADRDFVAKQKLTEGAEDIFVNTDSFIEGARSLDPVFKKKMFNED